MTRPTRIVTDDARAILSDGSALATDVSYVDDGRRRPALLIRTPYSRAAARDTHDVVGLARDDWAVVVQDVRGRFDSEGSFTPFQQEVSDGAEIVQWCAQQPWCDGRVVTTGASYLGAAQWAAASRRPHGLRGINPLLAPSEPPSQWLWNGDAFQVGMAAPWMLTMLASGSDLPPDVSAEAGRLAGAWRDVLVTPPEADPVRRLSADYDDWRSRSASAESWLPTSVPAFNVVGWFDIFAESGLAAHREQTAAGAPIVTVVGPWAHNERLTNLYPELDFGPLGNGELTDVRGQGLRWLRDRLDDPPADTEVRYFVMGLGEWRHNRNWPPPSEPVRMFLAEMGSLSTSPPEASGESRWRHDPAQAVPSWGGRVLGPFLPLPGPADQRVVEARDDVVVFTAPVVGEPLVVAGEITAHLVVSSSAATLDVAVKICDVHPDGRVFNVVDGLRRLEVTPGVPSTVVVTVGSTAHAFLPHHRLRVEVAGSSFPRYDVSPRQLAHHTVHWGGPHASHLVLPVSG